MGSGAPTAGSRDPGENGEGEWGKGKVAEGCGGREGIEIDRELLSLRSPVDSTFRNIKLVAQNDFHFVLI